MKYVVVSVFDRAIGAYGRPFFVAAVGAAVRSFQDEVNREGDNNELFRHPEDFDLYELGSFDDSVGKFNGLDAPRKIAYGGELKIKPL